MNESIWSAGNDVIRDRNVGKKLEDCIWVLGIDFGTSNSCVSIWNSSKKRVKVVKNPSTLCKISENSDLFSRSFYSYHLSSRQVLIIRLIIMSIFL